MDALHIQFVRLKKVSLLYADFENRFEKVFQDTTASGR